MLTNDPGIGAYGLDYTDEVQVLYYISLNLGSQQGTVEHFHELHPRHHAYGEAFVQYGVGIHLEDVPVNDPGISAYGLDYTIELEVLIGLNFGSQHSAVGHGYEFHLCLHTYRQTFVQYGVGIYLEGVLTNDPGISAYGPDYTDEVQVLSGLNLGSQHGTVEHGHELHPGHHTHGEALIQYGVGIYLEGTSADDQGISAYGLDFATEPIPILCNARHPADPSTAALGPDSSSQHRAIYSYELHPGHHANGKALFKPSCGIHLDGVSVDDPGIGAYGLDFATELSLVPTAGVINLDSGSQHSAVEHGYELHPGHHTDGKALFKPGGSIHLEVAPANDPLISAHGLDLSAEPIQVSNVVIGFYFGSQRRAIRHGYELDPSQHTYSQPLIKPGGVVHLEGASTDDPGISAHGLDYTVELEILFFLSLNLGSHQRAVYQYNGFHPGHHAHSQALIKPGVGVYQEGSSANDPGIGTDGLDCAAEVVI